MFKLNFTSLSCFLTSDKLEALAVARTAGVVASRTVVESLGGTTQYFLLDNQSVGHVVGITTYAWNPKHMFVHTFNWPACTDEASFHAEVDLVERLWVSVAYRLSCLHTGHLKAA